MPPSLSYTCMPNPSDRARNKLLQTKQRRNCIIGWLESWKRLQHGLYVNICTCYKHKFNVTCNKHKVKIQEPHTKFKFKTINQCGSGLVLNTKSNCRAQSNWIQCGLCVTWARVRRPTQLLLCQPPKGLPGLTVLQAPLGTWVHSSDMHWVVTFVYLYFVNTLHA